jgi:chorismate mutase
MSELDLNVIAARLEGLEETIISKLIDRAQFRINSRIYEPGQSGFSGESQKSLFSLRLSYQERMDARFGRFCVPEERPFNHDLPDPQRIVVPSELPLAVDNYDCINVTSDILQAYLGLVDKICREGDDGNYGSSVEHDVYAIQAIARRIHYGALYVAESKYRGNAQEYRKLIDRENTVAIMQLLTRKEVEERIMIRIREKVNTAQATVNRAVRHIIDPEIVVEFYRNTIIPLTKKGEVLYLMNRNVT